MQQTPTSARAVTSEPGLVTHSLFREGKAFLSETRADECIILAHRFLSEAGGATTVNSSVEFLWDEAAQRTAVDFKIEYGRRNFSSQTIKNESQLNDFLRDKWSDHEGRGKAMRSGYVL